MQKKINQNTTLSSNSDFFVRIYQQIHRITEHMLKKIKTKIDKKKIIPSVSCDTIQGRV
jgi:hypothetical protein